jgi:hypothetical protein
MKILKWIGIIILITVAAVLIMASMKPDVFRVERTANIPAAPEKIFPYLNDLKKSQSWSPWEDLDPDMKRTFSGPQSGKGAAYAWAGDKNIGEGSMEITESLPSSKVVSRLDFTKPFEAHNIVTYTLTPKGNTTDVTWTMEGPNTFLGKVISVVMNCDKMVGKQFETGLANLRTVVQAEG